MQSFDRSRLACLTIAQGAVTTGNHPVNTVFFLGDSTWWVSFWFPFKTPCKKGYTQRKTLPYSIVVPTSKAASPSLPVLPRAIFEDTLFGGGFKGDPKVAWLLCG